VARIQIERPVWLDKSLELLLRESTDKLQRYIEDLDAARDRAIVIKDEISNRLAEDMNERMYALAIIAGIFLPLGFLTGLLGINVGGMPGADYSFGFWVTCALLFLVLLGELYLFRRMKWI
jgi:zinc transporter